MISARRQSSSIKKKRSVNPVTLFLALILLTGLGIIAYPSFSDWWNLRHQTRAIKSYVEETAQMSSEEIDKIRREAKAYNTSLLTKPDRYYMTQEEKEAYSRLLDISGTGIMCYIEIPRINLSLPVYHGSSEEVLQTAIGHLEGSSLPVGGPGTHSVLSGHRGLPSARLFTDIDQLKTGDRFTIRVLNQSLIYQVDQIRTVLPDDIEYLEINEQKDYVTLITCTPYGINTHRLLVRGHRRKDLEGKEEKARARRIPPFPTAFIAAAPFLLFILILVLSGSRKDISKKEASALIRQLAHKDKEG